MSPAEQEEDRLLERCPRCLYLLRGLPVEHHCPECGLIVDRRWNVFGGRTMHAHTKRENWVLRHFIIFTVSFVGTAYLFANAGGVASSKIFLVVAIALYIASWMLIWTTIRMPRGFVAVGPNGLAIYFGKNRFEFYSWSEIGRSQYEILRKRIHIVRPPDDVHIHVHKFFGNYINEVDRCVQGINHYPRPAPQD